MYLAFGIALIFFPKICAFSLNNSFVRYQFVPTRGWDHRYPTGIRTPTAANNFKVPHNCLRSSTCHRHECQWWRCPAARNPQPYQSPGKAQNHSKPAFVQPPPSPGLHDGRPCLLPEPYVCLHAASSPCPHQHPRMWMDLVPRSATSWPPTQRGPFPEQNVTLNPLAGLSIKRLSKLFQFLNSVVLFWLLHSTF